MFYVNESLKGKHLKPKIENRHHRENIIAIERKLKTSMGG